MTLEIISIIGICASFSTILLVSNTNHAILACSSSLSKHMYHKPQ